MWFSLQCPSKTATVCVLLLLTVLAPQRLASAHDVDVMGSSRQLQSSEGESRPSVTPAPSPAEAAPSTTPEPTAKIVTFESFFTKAPTEAPGSAAAAANTDMPTVLIPLEDLPASVDMVECRNHLQKVDTDRNFWLNEEEYVKFVHQIVAHQVNNHTQEIRDPLWGHTIETLPPSIQNLYKELNQGGAVMVRGYMGDIELTQTQELFLMKVCIHTEIIVSQILNVLQESEEEFIQTVFGIPEPQVVLVYSSFTLSNKVGIASDHLQTGKNRDGLEEAYKRLVTRVVSQQTSIPMSMTETEPADHNQRRRRLTVSMDPGNPYIYRIDDTPCPSDKPDTPKTEWCQTGYGKFLLYLVARDERAVYNQYSKAVQNATADGVFQTALREVAPNSEVEVTGAGSTLLPPEPTPAPTRAPAPATTASNNSNKTNITIPEPVVIIGDPNVDREEEKINVEMIATLASLLFLINCCVIGISVYSCWKQRGNDDIDLGVYDEDPAIDEAYYQDLRAKRKSRMESSRSMRSTSSAAPTLEDIYEAQAPAPSPAPMPMSSDALERERILQGSAVAPSREEIESKLPPSDTGVAAPLTGYEEENDDKLKVEEGEMV